MANEIGGQPAGEAPQKRSRSWLFTPGTRRDRYGGAQRAGADVAILDLEDAVALPQKAEARKEAISFLASRPAGPIAWALRINTPACPDGLADLLALLESDADPDFVILPKTDSGSTLAMLDRLLSFSGKRAQLVGLIESAEGLSRIEEIAGATPRLHSLLFGAADMAADLGCANTWTALVHTRNAIVAACARAHIIAVDSQLADAILSLERFDRIETATRLGRR